MRSQEGSPYFVECHLPVRVSADVIIAEEGEDLPVLDDLQGAGDHEDEVGDALALPDDEVPGCAVCHLEVGGQGAQAAVTGQSERWVAVKHSPVCCIVMS